MAALVAAIHVSLSAIKAVVHSKQAVDAREKPGHDGLRRHCGIAVEIIARETVKTTRKDVPAKCTGGG